MARAVDKSKLVQVPLTGGINQAIDERDAPPGTLVRVENCRIRKSLLNQRPGFDAISASNVSSVSQAILGDGTATVIEKPALISRVGDAPVLATTSGKIYASNAESGTPWFTEGGYISTCTPVGYHSNIQQSPFTTVLSTSTSPATALDSNGNRLVVYLDATTLIASVYSPEGKPIRMLSLATVTLCERIVAFAIGTTFYVVRSDDNGTATIKLTTFSVTQGGLSALTSATVATLTSGLAIYFDAVPTRTISGSPCWALVYSQSTAATITVASMTGSTVRHSSTQAVGTPAAGIPTCSLYWDADYNYLWVGYQSQTGLPAWFVRSDDDPATIIKATQNITPGGSDAGPPLFGKWHGPTVASESTTMYVVRNPAEVSVRVGLASISGGSGAFGTIPHCRPVSKPDNYGRVWFLLGDDIPVGSETEQSVATYWYVLARLRTVSGLAVVASSIELYSGAFPAATFGDLLFGANSNQFAAQAVGTSENAVALICSLGTAVDVRQFFWTTGEQSPHVASARGFPSMVTAGQPIEHFGDTRAVQSGISNAAALAMEIGFANAPKVRDNSSPAGTESRSIRAVLVRADVYGRKHTSAPSLPLTITTNITVLNPASVTIDTAGLGQCVSQYGGTTDLPYVEVYSTVDGGTDYFLSATAQLTSWPNPQTVSVALTDAALESQPFLYTDGGVLPNVLAPSGEFCVFTDSRLAVAGGFDRSIVTFSKIIIPTEPIQFTNSEAFQAVVPGAITALGFLDGTVVVFTEDAIYQINGDGPNDEGVGGFDGPTLIWAGVGCSSHASVLKTDDGIIYLNPQGFYLLPRGLGAPQYIGAQVRDETASYPVCLGSALTQTSNYYLARFLMAAEGATSTGFILTFDLQRQIWFKDIITIDGSTVAALSEIGNWPDGLTLMRESLLSSNTAPCVLQENESVATDGAVAAKIVQTLESAWVYPFQPGGYGHMRKCQIAFELLSTAATVGLTVEMDSNTPLTASWSATGTAGDIVYRELQLTPTQAGCIRVTLTETAGGGIRPVSCTLEVDDDSGIRLLSPSERV